MARLRQKHGIGTQADRDRLEREATAGESCAAPRTKAVHSTKPAEETMFDEQMRLF